MQAVVSCGDLSRATTFVFLGIAGALTAPAAASPRSDPTIGTAVFTGAATQHPTGITLNPATVGLGSGTTVYVGAAATIDQVGATTPAGDAQNVLSGSPGLDFALSWRVSDLVALGVRAASPVAETFFAPSDNSMRFASLGGRQRDYQLTPAVAFRTQRVVMGLAFTLGRSNIKYKFSRDTALDGAPLTCGNAPCGIGNPLAAQDYDLDVSSSIVSNIAVSIGTIVKITPTIYVGLGYHWAPGFNIGSSLTGELKVKQPSIDGGEIITGAAELTTSYPAGIDAEVRSEINPRWEAHIGGRWLDLSRLSAFDIRPYGAALRAANVPEWIQRARGFDDSVALWGGVEEIDRGNPLRFGARVGFETSSVALARTTITAIAGASLTAQGGAQWRFAPGWSLAAQYGFTYFLPRTISSDATAYRPADALACIAAEYDYTLPACQATRDGYAAYAGEGTYTRMQHSLRIGLRYDY